MNASIPRVALLLFLLLPGVASAQEPAASPQPAATPAVTASTTPQASTNVNSRYDVESATIVGVERSHVSHALRSDIRKLVGNKYDPDAAERLAERLREELEGYRISIKVRKGDQVERVKVIFEAERYDRNPFQLRVAPLLWTNNDAFSLALVPGFETHHNFFSFGFVTTANDVLKRESGITLRYEHRKVGTSMVQVGVEYDYFWSDAFPSLDGDAPPPLMSPPPTYGVYDAREVFAPSVSFLPIPDIKLTFGASFQTLKSPDPAPFDQAAHSFTFGAQYRKRVRQGHDVSHTITADYSVRDASRHLESDFLYNRQRAGADYTAAFGHQELAAHFEGGRINGLAPLFERFVIGSATTLRGWDKFEVTRYGGTRLLYGSLAYRYRPFELFYDFGANWDPSRGETSDWKNSVGVGLAWRNGFFMSIGVPCRFHGVTPAFMFGFRPQGRG